ncbi:class E sortase [Zhihengliuella salsuginis]|uniref:Class E sortase n=1 Tax=Zhihengliuella salsuginis TaxID=578222 RepID=A0ABQ3GKJ5_9MICC|nr:class E sortase [Zhihengliuella salsuginis]GHD11246.1 class E sortase [Zhihengliuella salsuginis]
MSAPPDGSLDAMLDAGAVEPRRRRQGRRRPSRGAAVVGVIGELLITVGLLVLLFVAWELWWTNLEADRSQDEATSALVETFGAPDVDAGPGGIGSDARDAGDQAAEDADEFGSPPAASLTDPGTFALMYVPRFGDDWVRPVTSGVGLDVLNNLGIGHYPETQLPGEPGNFAVAAHRQTHGQVFYNIDKLRDGDRVYVQTREGFYQYRYTGTEIVAPSQVDVLAPVPRQAGAEPSASVLTMTSCHPLYTTRERIIAYAELESFRPADAGPQDAILSAYQNTRN